MGRAIVREPAVFLMDEPLSNLDAKLRVQMRAELGLLHSRLGTTTVYVTHDQVEAMTLGHRVAVMKPVTPKRPDNLQQVAPPAELFHEPVNLFVAGFIGSPAMNLVNGHLESSNGEVDSVFGQHRLRVARRALDRHPGIEDHMNKELVIGIRPGDFEDSRVAGEAPERTMEVDIDLTEVLGSETFVHYFLPLAPVITPDIEELLADTGADASSLGNETKFESRISSDITVSRGDRVKLVVDTAKFHFFDPESGNRIGARKAATQSA